MHMTRKGFPALLSLAALILAPAEAAKRRSQWKIEKGEITGEGPAVLWRDPVDIGSRNLFYGAGGKEHEPRGVLRFVKEDLDGSNPKFVVEDEQGAKWKIKLGNEAQCETAASRLVWAAGYSTDQDYFAPFLKVEKMPQRLHRGEKHVTSDGAMRNVQIKRYPPGEEKIGNWEWADSPFVHTRELNGLRALMALINNWDLKDTNNSIYQEKGPSGMMQVYRVADLGASFAGTSYGWPARRSRGNLSSYQKSKFIEESDQEFIDFKVPSRPNFVYFFFGPRTYLSRTHLRWIGEDVPRDHAVWMGRLLARLSHRQIQDAFRGAGYDAEEVDGFSAVVERRIAQLAGL
jgi:hypothetical protein